MAGALKERDSSGGTDQSEDPYRTVEEVIGILGLKPLLRGLEILEGFNSQTLETLFRRPGRRGSGITNFPRAA